MSTEQVYNVVGDSDIDGVVKKIVSQRDVGVVTGAGGIGSWGAEFALESPLEGRRFIALGQANRTARQISEFFSEGSQHTGNESAPTVREMSYSARALLIDMASPSTDGAVESPTRVAAGAATA